MKKNIKRILDKTPLITIAINSDRNINYYNNFAKQKFLFLEEGRDINSVIRSIELNNFIEKAFSEKKDHRIEFQPSNFEDWSFIADLLFLPESNNPENELIISAVFNDICLNPHGTCHLGPTVCEPPC